ncbi:jun-like transcription factor [Saxophila tyrrhenica]|uniref:Jun-like transcription factor n=1 Tax=Saxophila tyrrhenica TaxID=1690608 RepID=A0AAV9PL27_9PEZI|nr:jun-like transcription factor [Saxophila tyrrhenica]
MARKDVKSTVPDQLWPSAWGQPPPLDDVLGQIAGFLGDLGYTDVRSKLQKQAKAKGLEIEGSGPKDPEQGLLSHWKQASTGKINKKKDESSSDESSDDSSSASSSEEDSEDDEKDEEKAEGGALVDDEAEETSDDGSEAGTAPKASAKVGTKRKRSATSSSEDSNSESSSESESDEDALKVDGSSSSDSSSSSSSDSSSESSEGERPLKKKTKTSHSPEKSVNAKKKASAESSSSGSSSSGSSSSDSSSSDSESDAKPAAAKKAKKSASDSSSSSSSSSDSGSSSSASSDSESEAAPSPKKATKEQSPKKKAKALEASATSSSATLGAEDSSAEKQDTLLVPTADPNDDTMKQIPATKENVKKLKKEAVPFSRIPADQKVDPRFSSNNYVPYDYADRAYQDLSVTKGKGFTKEKNKKKRGESISTDYSSSSDSEYDCISAPLSKPRTKANPKFQLIIPVPRRPPEWLVKSMLRTLSGQRLSHHKGRKKRGKLTAHGKRQKKEWNRWCDHAHALGVTVSTSRYDEPRDCSDSD